MKVAGSLRPGQIEGPAPLDVIAPVTGNRITRGIGL